VLLFFITPRDLSTLSKWDYDKGNDDIANGNRRLLTKDARERRRFN
jgi:hypothetical protein